jgi:hypothetical protein
MPNPEPLAVSGLIEVRFRESGHFEKVSQQTHLQRLVTVNGDRKPDDAPGLSVDMMAAVDAEKGPGVALE